MRFHIFLLLNACAALWVFAADARAADEDGRERPVAAAPVLDVPRLGFAHQVEIVVETKRDPRVYEMKIAQENEIIHIDLIVDRDQDHEQVKQIAFDVVMRTKMRSLDDRPESGKEPGKGLYTYKVNITRPDGVVLLTAIKPRNKKKLRYEDPILPPQPWTRADANAR